MSLNNEINEAEKKAMRKRVFLMLRSLYVLFRGSASDVQMVDNYIKVWKPRSESRIADVVLWPYEGMKGNPRFSKKKNARCCLFALVTECIKEFHKYYADPDTFEGDMDATLSEVEALIKGKLMFPIKGSDKTGYYLWNKRIGKKSSEKTSTPPRR